MSIYDDARNLLVWVAADLALEDDDRYEAVREVAQHLLDLVEAGEKSTRLHDESRFKESVECWPDDWPCEHGEDEPHEFEMDVCGECGHASDGDGVFYRPWPCPTFTTLDATVRRIREETT